MSRETVFGILSIVIIVALAVFFLTSSKMEGGEHTAATTEEEKIAYHLAESDSSFFGAFWCGHCTRQKELFKDAVKLLTEEDIYIECSLPDRRSQREVCNDENISSYPTWKFDTEEGKLVCPSVLSLNALAVASEYPGFDKTLEEMREEYIELLDGDTSFLDSNPLIKDATTAAELVRAIELVHCTVE